MNNPTNIQSIMNNTFKMHPLGQNSYVTIICNVRIINEKYYIDFDYTYSSDINTAEKKNNILKCLDLYDTNLDEPYNGDIIHKNVFTDNLVTYLCMSNEELQKVSGNVNEENYRLNLIKCVQSLWD